MVSLFAVDRGDLLCWLPAVALYVLVTVCVFAFGCCICLFTSGKTSMITLSFCACIPFETLLYSVAFSFLYTCICYAHTSYTVLKRCHKNGLLTYEECRSLAKPYLFSKLLSLQLKKSADVRQRTVDVLTGTVGGSRKTLGLEEFRCK